MNRITLSVSIGDYDLNRPLLDGRVTPQGVDLVGLTYSSPERHWRMIRDRAFDVCELSLGSYLTLCDQGRDDLVALPIFPRRRFRHSYIYVSRAAEISSPTDLNGRRVGLRTWQTTSAVWVKGILGDHYGVDLSSIEWLAQAEEAVPLVPPGVDLELVGAGELVDEMLEAGKLDALIYPGIPRGLGKRSDGAPIVRMFETFPDEEVAYYQETGIFPIMHTVVVARDVLDRWPWLVGSLMEAFRAARDEALRELLDARATSLAWASEVIERQTRVLGANPWPYDLPGNAHTLGKLVNYAHGQGLIARRPDLESLFHPAALEEVPEFG